MIIAGERRWRAANLAGLTEVPAIEFDIDEKTIAEIALIENLQRKDLTVWEEADGLAYLSRKFGYTHEEIAKKIGKSRSTVTESMAIAGIPEAIRAKCLQTNVSAKSVLLEIARQFDEPAMHEYVKNIGGGNLRRDEIRRAAVRKQAAAIPPGGKPSFRYVSADKNFSVEIVFNQPGEDGRKECGKKDLLRALREAFQSVKDQ